METGISPFQVFGIILIILGVLVFIAPLILAKLPSLEKIPWILLYVYRSDSFTFVTSPILLIISLLFLLWSLIIRTRS